MSRVTFASRRMLENFASLLAQAGPPLIGESEGRITPIKEVVNVFEVEAVAKRKLPAAVYSSIAGSDRRAFERMTFRPRMLVNVTQMDLSVDLFGVKLFTPIVIGPLSEQKLVHPEGEVAMARGASAAKTVMVASSRSSFPLEKIAAEAKAGLWYQVFPEPDLGAVRNNVQQAVQSGCKAVFLTVGTPYRPSGADGPPNPTRLHAMGNPHLDWSSIDQLRQGLAVPFVLKGIMSPEEAETAVKRGAQGIVVSDYGGLLSSGLASPIEVLPAIADAVGGKIPILIDGSFRRGTDILKALALGAQAVMVGRPALWGLGAYGSEGVETVLRMLQSELARDMGLCGKANLKALDRSVVKIHLR